jgi:hypothetical protein
MVLPIDYQHDRGIKEQMWIGRSRGSEDRHVVDNLSITLVNYNARQLRDYESAAALAHGPAGTDPRGSAFPS